MRGGVSDHTDAAPAVHESSPRAWGCFFQPERALRLRCVFPTCVGVFPLRGKSSATSSRLPHVRGGVSASKSSLGGQMASSPRAWGCFSAFPRRQRRARVFPTCVGVFPRRSRTTRSRRGLPHVRGGVSTLGDMANVVLQSSPRAWGCFHSPLGGRPVLPVFPTCVGVFPILACPLPKRSSLPHVRGGVSSLSQILVSYIGSSPRAWGCF